MAQMVHFWLVYPSDQSENQRDVAAMTHIATAVREWYATVTTNGTTFEMDNPSVNVITSSLNTTNFWSGSPFNNMWTDIQANSAYDADTTDHWHVMVGGGTPDSGYTYTNRGGTGALRSYIEKDEFDKYWEGDSWSKDIPARYIAHELAHQFGMNHTTSGTSHITTTSPGNLFLSACTIQTDFHQDNVDDSTHLQKRVGPVVQEVSALSGISSITI